MLMLMRVMRLVLATVRVCVGSPPLYDYIQESRTALHCASRNCHVEVVSELLKAVAHVNTQNKVTVNSY